MSPNPTKNVVEVASHDLFSVFCYRAICDGLSMPDTWITGQSRESAEYHARHGRMIERRDHGCYHGPFRILPDKASVDAHQ
jgi:hypothetical protein